MDVKSAIIRRATEEDLPILMGLYRQLDLPGERELDAELDPTIQHRTVFEQISADEHQHIFVACLGSDVVASFVLMIAPNLAHGCAPWALVENVVVDGSYRGIGVGKAMMEFAMARAAEAGCYKIVLSSNLVREEAHHFYESMGWRLSHYGFSIHLRH